eukprot:TRINITY_DN8147_c0_g2_i3.p1 TRINITY_DN8147_c0_g2~~TRINITY_DN8147_c0_g2_i3.p1  ORF type:complete len:530 (+),score=127.19 TRINITY_DN8147_c0_g2_i3:59-1591(+)
MPLLPLLLALAAASAGEVRRWVSSEAGLRLAAQSPVQWEAVQDAAVVVAVDSSKRFQRMRGFGASFLESGAVNLNKLPPRKQDELLDLLFSPSGAALSAMKATIPSNDFASQTGKWHTYDDVKGDVALQNFSIACDLTANGTLTLIKRAQRHGFQGYIQSYMDYPPDWMLLGALPGLATVNPKYYDALAGYYAKFVQAYAEHGVTVDYLSLFNEPMDSYTHIHDAGMKKLLGQHVGPLFDRLGLRPRTKLTYGGQATRQSAATHVTDVMSDAKAATFMDHIAYHGYDCQYNCSKQRQQYDKVGALHDRWPGLELWMTEICYAYNGDDPNCKQASTMSKCTDYPRNHSLAPALPRFEFSDGRVWGSRIVSDVTAGVSGWIYWNLLLDMDGGPFLYSPRHNDDGANLQQAVIHIDPSAGTYHTTGLFWYLAHFSRFVRDGSTRIDVNVTGAPASDLEGMGGVEAVAFELPGGGFVALLLNHDASSHRAALRCGGRQANVDLPPVSITTAQWA